MKIYIRTDNDAFANDSSQEVCRILRELADKIEKVGAPKRGRSFKNYPKISAEIWNLYDSNGNLVGTVRR